MLKNLLTIFVTRNNLNKNIPKKYIWEGSYI